MRRWARNLLILCGGTAIVSLALWEVVLPHIWLKLEDAVVSLDGQPNGRAAVYRSIYGDLLICGTEPSGGAPHIVRPSERLVGAENVHYITQYACFAWSTNKRALGVRLGTAKADVEPNL